MRDFANTMFSSVCSDIFGSPTIFNSWFGDYPFDWTQWRPQVPYTLTYTTSSIGKSDKLSKELVSADYPPSNVIIDSNKNLVLELAVAGYKKENISIEQSPEDSNYLRISVSSGEETKDTDKEDKGKKPEKVYLQKGISTKKSYVEFYVDPQKFDITKVSASLVDGILTVNVGKNENAKVLKSVKID